MASELATSFLQEYLRTMKSVEGRTQTVESYLAQLPDDRREVVAKVRQVVRANLREGFEEGIQYGMIGYYVPHSIFPPGYHANPSEPLPFAHIGSQKNHIAVYLMGLYGDPAREKAFREQWAKTGKKLNMGKSCIRFKKVEDLALDVLAKAIRGISVDDYVSHYKETLGDTPRGAKKPPKKPTAKPSPTKKAVASASRAPISETRPKLRATKTQTTTTQTASSRTVKKTTTKKPTAKARAAKK